MTSHNDTATSSSGSEGSLTPPPPAVDHAASAPAAPQRGSTGKIIAIITACVGGVALLGTAGSAVFAGWWTVEGDAAANENIVADVAGMTSLEMEVGAADISVEFGDVEQAELVVTNGRSDWLMDRNGEALVIHSPSENFRYWTLNDWDSDEKVTLTLPQRLEDAALDADLFIGAGSLDVRGDFGDVSFEVGAGALTLTGSAENVLADLSAGRATLDLTDVRTADLTISAGRLTADLRGEAPEEVTFDVSAGSLALSLPDEEYNVRQEVSAGSLDNELRTNPKAPRIIQAEVSAGSATLRGNG